MLSTVEVAAVEAVRSAWVLARRWAAALAVACAGVSGPRAAERVVLACEGKVVRGSRSTAGPATALFAVFEHRHRWVLTQRAISDSDEVAAFTATLDTVGDLRDVLIAAHARHPQREDAT